MKKKLSLLMPGLLAISLLLGCKSPQPDNGANTQAVQSPMGQRLRELQQARDNGTITDSQYQAEKNRLLQLDQP